MKAFHDNKNSKGKRKQIETQIQSWMIEGSLNFLTTIPHESTSDREKICTLGYKRRLSVQIYFLKFKKESL